MMREYRATFRRAGGDFRHPSFTTEETDPEILASLARQHLSEIPFLKMDGWELVSVSPIEQTTYEQSEAGIQALTATLISRIRQGSYPPEGRFPNCAQICEEFRATERVATLALAQLRKRKYVHTVGRGSSRRYYVLPSSMWLP